MLRSSFPVTSPELTSSVPMVTYCTSVKPSALSSSSAMYCGAMQIAGLRCSRILVVSGGGSAATCRGQRPRSPTVPVKGSTPPRTLAGSSLQRVVYARGPPSLRRYFSLTAHSLHYGRRYSSYPRKVKRKETSLKCALVLLPRHGQLMVFFRLSTDFLTHPYVCTGTGPEPEADAGRSHYACRAHCYAIRNRTGGVADGGLFSIKPSSAAHAIASLVPAEQSVGDCSRDHQEPAVASTGGASRITYPPVRSTASE